MSNPGQPPPSRPRAGTVLTAEEMNRIVQALISRIDGGKGIRIKNFGGRIIIESTDQ
jgi:hypothetical protein